MQINIQINTNKYVWNVDRDFTTFFSFLRFSIKFNTFFAFVKLSFPKIIFSLYHVAKGLTPLTSSKVVFRTCLATCSVTVVV